ncbi:MAG: hypothetical protein QOI65_1768, partial [Thermoleophilaceae bacterium]|nr:hypothetical protein [Thermoleophilaceae bacterium]
RLEDGMSAIRDGFTRVVSSEPRETLREIARAGQTDPALVRAEFAVIRSAFLTGTRLPEHALRNWARFDVKYGILKRAPDGRAAFEDLVGY